MSWRSISLFNYPFHYKNVQTTLWGIPNIHRRHINPNIVLGYARSPFISLYHLISSLVGHVALSKLYPQELQAPIFRNNYEKAWDGIWGKTQSKSFTA